MSKIIPPYELLVDGKTCVIHNVIVCKPPFFEAYYYNHHIVVSSSDRKRVKGQRCWVVIFNTHGKQVFEHSLIADSDLDNELRVCVSFIRESYKQKIHGLTI